MQLSPKHVAGATLVALAATLFVPLIADIPASDLPRDKAAKLILAGFGIACFLLSTGVLCWRHRIPGLNIEGREFFARLLLICAPFALVAIAELAFIAIERRTQSLTHADLQAMQIMADSRGGKHYKKHKLFTPSHNPLFRVNRLGFRTYEFDRKHDGELRIALLGGSTVLGWGVSESNTIGRFIETRLSARLGRRVLVFNLGLPAIGFQYENLALADFAEIIRPDLVVFYHGANDGYAQYPQIVGKTDARATLDPAFFSVSTFVHLIYQVRVMREAINLTRAIMPDQNDRPFDYSRAVAAYKADYVNSKKYCKKIDCLYVLQPTIFERVRQMDNEYRIVQETLRRWPDIDRVYRGYIDRILAKAIPDHFDARNVVRHVNGHIFYDHVHKTSLGNRILGEFIADTICGQEYLSC